MSYPIKGDRTGYISAELVEGVLEVRLVRPEKRNALTHAMAHEYNAILDAAELDDAVKAVMLTGDGPVFSAGHDIADPVTVGRYERGEPGPPTPRSLPRAWYFNKPIIAGVHGYVGPGGFEITATADFIVAGEGTRWSYEITRKGGTAPSGTYLLLNYQLPMRVVKKLWMMGGWFTAEDALGWNFVQRVVDPAEVQEETRRWAREAAKIPPRQYKAGKQSLHRFYEIAGLATAIAAQDMASGHGSDEDKQFWTDIREGGLTAQLAARDEGFDQGIARV